MALTRSVYEYVPSTYPIRQNDRTCPKGIRRYFRVRSYGASRESILSSSEGLEEEILRIVETLGQGQHDDLSTILN